MLSIGGAYSQKVRFNAELDRFCKTSLAKTSTIPKERKAILDDIAKRLVNKKYILFTCKTNSRRTIMLQVWAQTAFYYYGLYNKLAFSMGDTVTGVYPEVTTVLMESGFYCRGSLQDHPEGYLISVNEELPDNLLQSKNELGKVDTSKGQVINICYTPAEQSSLATTPGHIDLPYQSPTPYDKTPQEKLKYAELNRQISVEMLYMAGKVREQALKSE